MSKKAKIRSNLGNVYRSKRWAKRFARGRPIREVPGGWMICRKRRRKVSKKKTRRLKSSRKRYRRKSYRRRSRRQRTNVLIIEF